VDLGNGRESRGSIILPETQSRGSAGIAAQLRRAITDGIYSYGDRLPAEREMARSFGASRTTVRSALDLLEKRNFIQRKVGSGTFVVHDRGGGEREIADITSPLELMDMRQAMEPHMVRLAVLHGTARDMEALAQNLRRLEQARTDREQFTRYDQEFHMAIANATHNPLAVWVYRQINEVRQHRQWSRVKDKILSLARIAEYNRQHRALFEAIAGRNTESAIELINRHLAEARRDLVGAQST
jgi:DNA-binding FadR family transcriptional regulator